MLRRAAEAACVALFAAVFVIFVLKIVMRYAAHDPLAWADEVSVVLFIWIIFLANSLVVEDHRQIRFDLLYNNVNPKNRRLLAIIRSALIAAIFLAALPGAIDYTRFLWRERTPVLLWRLDLVYSCFALFMLAVIVHLLRILARLATRSWRDAL